MPSIIKLIKNPAKLVYIFDRTGISKIIPDRSYIKLKYKANFDKKINLKSPKTFSEKLQWLKLNYRRPEFTEMVDKYEAKYYVEKRIGKEYIIPTLGVWDCVDEIDFELLPDKFVLKCTHDSGGVVICKDKAKFDIEKAKIKIKKALKKNFYVYGREWPYKNIKPRIIAEEYMEDELTGELRDYKFFCFDGEAKALFIATERNKINEEVKFDFFNMNFEHLDLIHGHPNSKEDIKKPETFDKMRMLAEKLSKGIPHIRVDFYEINGKVYFGELTFFHHNGFIPFEPNEWDLTFGNWIKLP